MRPKLTPRQLNAPSKRWARPAVGGLLVMAFLLLALPALWPFVQLGLTFSDDGPLHVLRIAMLSTYQQEGMVYPRWMPDLVLGYGYPLLSFYAPATYYAASLFMVFGADPTLALLLTFVALMLLAGGGMALLIFDLVGETEGWKRYSAALAGGVTYLYAPYLLTNVFVRGAVAEVGAQMLLPWILWSLRRTFYASNPIPYGLGLALSLALLALTHNISLLLMPPIIVVYGLAIGWQMRRLSCSANIRGVTVIWASMAAMGLSAFFWLPLLFERTYLSETMYAIVAQYMTSNIWTLSNFLEMSWPYAYSPELPFRLGMVQVLLAIMGFMAAPRRTAEWWVLFGVLLFSVFMISAWALPIWLNVEVLWIAQFPWRLLAIASLPLALFPVGIILAVKNRLPTYAVALMLILFVILSHRPSVNAFTVMLPDPVPVGAPAVAQFEFQTQAYGTSSWGEFLPKWANRNLFGISETSPKVAPLPLAIQLQSVSPVSVGAVVTTSSTIDLNITDFYFPGVSATIDGSQTKLVADPVRGTQILSIPTGAHRITISREGTLVQQIGTWISLATLAVSAIVLWLKGMRWRWLALAPVLCLALSAYGAQQVVSYPGKWDFGSSNAKSSEWELLGFRYHIEQQRVLQLFPYWLVHSPSAGRVHWRLLDPSDQVIADTSSEPFFNTLPMTSIPAQTLFDDAYQIALPPKLAGGIYKLQFAVDSSIRTQGLTYFTAGNVELPDIPEAPPQKMNPLNLRFGSAVLLDGWDMRIDGADVYTNGVGAPALRPGQVLEYTLYWRADGIIDDNYHGFIHLLDHQQQAVYQHDKTAGSLLSPARLWNQFYVQPDTYRFVIADTMAGGLLWPTVGLYSFARDGQRLPITDSTGRALGDAFALPPIKVLSTAPLPSIQIVNARLADWGELQGFSAELSSGSVAPGEALTVTLVYRATQPAPASFTRFLHVYNPIDGMVAQQDAPPLNGGNPTMSWISGETIAETVHLVIPSNAPSGKYTVWFGMYEPTNGQRVALYTKKGARLPDDQLALFQVTVENPDLSLHR